MNWIILAIVIIIVGIILIKVIGRLLTVALILLLIVAGITVIDHFTGSDMISEVSDTYDGFQDSDVYEDAKQSILNVGNKTKNKISTEVIKKWK